MATTLERLLDTGTLSAKVYGITKNAQDAAAAAGYGAWVQSVTGTYPAVQQVTLPGSSRSQALLTLTTDQQVTMRHWIEREAARGRDAESSLQIDFSRVINPLVVKYAVILLALGFMGGFFARGAWR